MRDKASELQAAKTAQCVRAIGLQTADENRLKEGTFKGMASTVSSAWYASSVVRGACNMPVTRSEQWMYEASLLSGKGAQPMPCHAKQANWRATCVGHMQFGVKVDGSQAEICERGADRTQEARRSFLPS